jgi:cell division protein ZapE
MTKSPLENYRDLLASGEILGDPAQARAAEALDALAHTLQSYKPQARGNLLGKLLGGGRKPPRGLYIHGDVGRGKSMLMDLFFHSVSSVPKRRIHFNAFMMETHSRIHEWRRLSSRERVARPEYVKEAGDDPIPPVARRIRDEALLLCFDEFQVTDVADAMILGRLFEHLFTEGVVVVLTTNTAPARLYEGGLNRQLFLPFIALIQERMEVIHLDAERDYRLNRMAGLDLYMTPLSPESDARMDKAWRKLTDSDGGAAMNLTVLGRKLLVPRAAKGVARFSFTELCEKPLGAADYLALARNFHTIMVDRIPVIPPENRNEARRLTLLIDTLYDEKVKLICSAATDPEHLHVAGDSAEAFRRTASRLLEMQSVDYLKLGHGARARAAAGAPAA